MTERTKSMETEKNFTDFENIEKSIAQITVTANNGYITCHLDGETPFLLVAAANALCEVSIHEKIPLPKLMWKIYGIAKDMKKKAPKCREEDDNA